MGRESCGLPARSPGAAADGRRHVAGFDEEDRTRHWSNIFATTDARGRSHRLPCGAAGAREAVSRHLEPLKPLASAPRIAKGRSMSEDQWAKVDSYLTDTLVKAD